MGSGEARTGTSTYMESQHLQVEDIALEPLHQALLAGFAIPETTTSFPYTASCFFSSVKNTCAIKSNYLSVALLGSQDISLIFVNVQDE